jgi:sterol desaturase/sphingolipid hydroxylase (fatty acid hydroxylase superfamily)
MDTTYGRAVSLAAPIFLILIAVELIADRARGTRYYRLADAVNSVSCGIVSTGMRVFFGFLTIYFYDWALTRFAPVRLDAGHWLTWLFAFVLYDFCYYWEHRLGHRVGLLWASHVVHHQSEEFNLTTALRQPALGTFTAWIFYLPLALCGVPLGVFLVVGVAQLFYQFWPHTRHIGKLGVLDRWVQTPSNHRVHHAQNTIYLDKNYVGVFLLWDRLFGTFEPEREDEVCIYGIRGQLKSWNPVWANFHYYWAMACDAVRSGSLRQAVRIWFGPPGYSKCAYDPQRDFVRFDVTRSTGLSLYALVQFLALAGANSHLLYVLDSQPLATSALYFCYIVGTLITLGGVLENRSVWIVTEAARLLATAAAVLRAGTWFGGADVAGPIVLLCVVSTAHLWFVTRGAVSLRARAATGRSLL